MADKKTKKFYFSLVEIIIFTLSVSLILLSFFLFSGEDYLSLFTSILGVLSLLLCAKGNPIGQMLVIVFGIVYAYISFSFSYYGEVITYAFMTVPMAVLSLVSWLKNPYKDNHIEVEVSRVSKKEIPLLFALAVCVTGIMFLALWAFGTANLLVSTVSVFTSFIAVYLTYRRSPYFALAYAVNDIVLVVLWTLASIEDSSYVAVVTCFGVFFINDIYGFINWKRMEKRQAKS